VVDDSSIATIAATIADGQDARARPAMQQADNPRVRKLAVAIDADLSGARIATMQQLGPRSSELDQELATETDHQMRSLAVLRGGEFDRAFVAAEQASLVESIRALDETLIPRAVGADLGRRLSGMRADLDAHLKEADAIAVALRGSP
jgi:putative membrane protein